MTQLLFENATIYNKDVFILVILYLVLQMSVLFFIPRKCVMPDRIDVLLMTRQVRPAKPKSLSILTQQVQIKFESLKLNNSLYKMYNFSHFFDSYKSRKMTTILRM